MDNSLSVAACGNLNDFNPELDMGARYMLSGH